MMDIGDKVKLVKGNPSEKIGTIKLVTYMTRPVNATCTPTGIEDTQLDKCFECEADDGTGFSGFKDDLELLDK